MSGTSIGHLKGKTGFDKKGYKPGSMITQMNKKNPALSKPAPVIKSIIKKII